MIIGNSVDSEKIVLEEQTSRESAHRKIDRHFDKIENDESIEVKMNSDFKDFFDKDDIKQVQRLFRKRFKLFIIGLISDLLDEYGL